MLIFPDQAFKIEKEVHTQNQHIETIRKNHPQTRFRSEPET